LRKKHRNKRARVPGRPKTREVANCGDALSDDRTCQGDAQGGFQRSGLKSLLWGEPLHLRRGGNPPRPGLPQGETEKGESKVGMFYHFVSTQKP
jgi:hypothetical protein